MKVITEKFMKVVAIVVVDEDGNDEAEGDIDGNCYDQE